MTTSESPQRAAQRQRVIEAHNKAVDMLHAEAAREFDVDKILAAVRADDHIGFCLDCGFEAGGVEPDARKYPCEKCGEKAVYGAPELMIMVTG